MPRVQSISWLPNLRTINIHYVCTTPNHFIFIISRSAATKRGDFYESPQSLLPSSLDSLLISHSYPKMSDFRRESNYRFIGKQRSFKSSHLFWIHNAHLHSKVEIMMNASASTKVICQRGIIIIWNIFSFLNEGGTKSARHKLKRTCSLNFHPFNEISVVEISEMKTVARQGDEREHEKKQRA